MTQDTTEADGAEEIAELFVDVREGDRLTFEYETPDGEERTVRAEAATGARATELTRDEPAAGNIAFWYRDLDRGAVPYAVVRYQPSGQSAPVVRLHGYTPEAGSSAGIEFLGEVKYAMRIDADAPEEDDREGNFTFSEESQLWLHRLHQELSPEEIEEIKERQREEAAEKENDDA
ncbi:hypothetical protein [Candidatus Halobonum tyrrellensis]|uniref:Uncharacterized protein n=1 Tax=Candidatus Halobonum tyrrellensis G22 TaxID=1324957 RepID=V4H9Z7_9EURY|nr:hypothetical protein [Candidatus Halobonum tyrrellensis]ESP86863.1 hypothetical protein K933_17307 [Candidatus Halobonum tyrrellensis G22]